MSRVKKVEVSEVTVQEEKVVTVEEKVVEVKGPVSLGLKKFHVVRSGDKFVVFNPHDVLVGKFDNEEKALDFCLKSNALIKL